MFEDYADVIGDDRQRADWLRQRQLGIGASEAATVLGLNPWSSPLELYAQKVGAVVPESNLRMRFGRYLEPAIAEVYAEQSQRKIDRCGLLLRSKHWPWLLATPDYSQSTDAYPIALVEIKDSSRVADYIDGPPPDVMCQVQHQMAVTGLEMVTVAVALDRNELRWWDVVRAQEWIEETLVPRTQAFWDAVQAQQPPPPTQPQDRKVLSRLYPQADQEKVVEAGPAICEVDQRRLALLEQKRELDQGLKAVKLELERADALLLAEMGEAGRMVLPDGTEYLRTVVQRKGYEVKPTSYPLLKRRKGTK